MRTILKAKEKTDASATNIDMYSIQTSLISLLRKEWRQNMFFFLFVFLSY